MAVKACALRCEWKAIEELLTVKMCVCVCVCVCACVCVHVSLSLFVCVFVCMCLDAYVRVVTRLTANKVM